MNLSAARAYLLLPLPEDMRKQQHLIERDINKYMAEFEVRPAVSLEIAADDEEGQAADTPDHIARMIFRLEKWYKEWSPIPE